MRGRMVLSWEDGLNALVAEGIVAIVFRTVGDQCSLWESVLPEELRRLPEELARVDALLDDPAFFAPFVPFFDPRIGRPSTPMETYLRLMFLKFRYRLGYESLCREVSDSISWRMFCRIPLDVSVPHPTTLMKLTTPPTGYAQTRRWCRRTWPIRPIRACWRRRCAGSPRRVSGSRPPAARGVAGCGTGRGRRASARTRSRRNCARAPPWAARRLPPRCSRAPVSWPD